MDKSLSSSSQLTFGMDRLLDNQSNKHDIPMVKGSWNESVGSQGSSAPSEALLFAFGARSLLLLPQLGREELLRPASDTSICTATNLGRKRTWSRAVFSNLQRKGLERRFQMQKYITKPDRRMLAASLGLTDAQVKVWFQNRRMKWRHCELKVESTKETLISSKEEEVVINNDEELEIIDVVNDPQDTEQST